MLDGWLEHDGLRLHFVEWPSPGEEGRPPILLLHGLSSNARYWDRVAAHLPARRLVALDQRGHGLTGGDAAAPTAPEAYAMDRLVGDAASVIDRLGLAQPVVVGHSWGATVALETAAALGDRVSGLVFVDGPVQSVRHFLTWDEAQVLMQPPLPVYTSMDEAIADSRRDFKEAWAGDLEPFVSARVMPRDGSLVLTLTGPVRLELLRGMYDSRPEDLWPKLRVPSAALVATRSFARVSRSTEEGVKRLEEIAPEVQVKHLDSPHDIPLYLPAEVAAEIEAVAQTARASLR